MRWVYLFVALATVGAALRWGWESTGLAVFVAGLVALALVVAFWWVADSAPPVDGQRVVIGEIVDAPGMYVLGVDLNGDGTIDRVKLGRSGVSMKDRASDLQAAAFARLWPVASYPTPAPLGTEERMRRSVATKLSAQLETEWHRRYAAQHVDDDATGTEWFRLEGRLHADLLAEGAVLNTRFLK